VAKLAAEKKIIFYTCSGARIRASKYDILVDAPPEQG
jgi:hypothetical protein